MSYIPRILLTLAAAWSSHAALIVREPEPGARMSRNDPVIGWLEMPMDHFHASNMDTWNMRYYYNPEFAPAANASHVLILVGGEWTISPGWLTTGLMYEMAEELGAAMFYTEHRYYGQSRPTEDSSTENLRYLNVDQALGDLAVFITRLKTDFEGGRYANANIGLVGCSYAGSMVTWMRLGYPHLVKAGYSISGPLHAQEDFPEYLEVITSALRTQGSEECVAAVRESMEQLVALLDTENGPQTVSTMFNTCSTLNAQEPLDLASFFWYGITETFAYLVQYAVPGQIPTACAALADPTVSDPVQRLASWVTSQRGSCIQSDYAEIVAAHTDTSLDSYDSVMRLWTYQTCVEYGWYQTTSSADQPFLSTVPLEYFHTQCRDFFGDYFNEDTLRAGIRRSNILFGGLTFLPDHVVSVGGGDDPWSPMGPVSSDVDLAPVYMVPATSHCRAMRSVADSESEEMVWAKNMAKVHMLSWMTDTDYKLEGFNGAAAFLPSVALLAAAVAAILV